MSGDIASVVLPRGIARRPQAKLDALNARFFSVAGRQVLQSDLSRASRWPSHSVLHLFLTFEHLGVARVEVRAFHSESGALVAKYRFADGPPDMPIEVEEEEFTGTIDSVDDLEFEISAIMIQPVVLTEPSA